jgi:hypothetical protein
MPANVVQGVGRFLRQLYLDDKRPWLVGFSGGNRFDEKGEAARDPDDVP